MKSRLHLFILFLSIAALAAGVYLGYVVFEPVFQEIWQQIIGVPEVPEEPEPEDFETPEACEEAGFYWYDDACHPDPEPVVDVELPAQLRERIEISRSRQRELFDQARSAHRAGELDRALGLYRRVLGTSGMDEPAALSYRYLGDIRAVRDNFDEAEELYGYSLDVIDTFPETYYRRARVRSEVDKTEEAFSDFDAAIDLDPRSLFLLARGNLHAEQGNFEQAVADYSRGLEEGGYEELLYFNRGLTQLHRQDLEAATDDFAAARQHTQETKMNYQLALLRGGTLVDLNRIMEAQEEFEQALVLRDTPTARYNLSLARLERGDTAAALSALEPAADVEVIEGPLQESDIHLQLGYLYQAVNDFERAIQFYERALEVADQGYTINFALGRLHEKEGRPSEAVENYNAALDDPAIDDHYQRLTYRRLGELGLNHDQLAAAQTAFRNLIQLDPANHEAFYNLGVANFRDHDLGGAIEALRDAVEIAPDSVDYVTTLGKLYFWYGERTAARQQFERVLELAEENFFADQMIAYIDYRRGAVELARSRYDSLLARSVEAEQRARLKKHLGNTYLLEGETTRAIESYRAAVEEYELPQAYYNLGLVFIIKEDWNRATSTLELARDLIGDDSRVETALGYVLFNRGLFEEARARFEQALDIDPENLRARYDLQRTRERLDE